MLSIPLGDRPTIVWELINAGGWVMAPIIGCSMIAAAIIAERLWCLRAIHVVPTGLIARTWAQLSTGQLDSVAVRGLRASSSLGRMIAAAVDQSSNAKAPPRAQVLERIEQVGRQEAHDLGRYLNTLGSIAAVTPLLGLLGTVIGMVAVFNGIDSQGLGQHQALAGGIGEALITTGAGLCVAIPSLIAHRYLRARVTHRVMDMEREALKWIDVLERQGRIT